jgi:C-terminal processing protease CtpA/Prc
VAGTGYIVSERPIDDRAIARHGMASHSRLSLSDGLVAHVRTSLMIHEDGSTGMQADLVSVGDALPAAFAAAGGSVSHVQRPRAPLVYGVRAPEAAYGDEAYPSRALRLLAAIRVWAVFEWLNPYHDLMGDGWERVLQDSVPKLLDARDGRSYHLAVAEMVAHVRDTHAIVLSPVLDEFLGTGAPGITVRPVEGKAVVTRVDDPDAGIAVGDIVLRVDGVSVDDRLAMLGRYISASTPQALRRDTVNALLRGPDGVSAELTIHTANGTERVVTLPRKAAHLANVWRVDGGEPFRLLPSGFGYLDLRLIKPHQVDTAFDALGRTKGLILDMRGYPNGTTESLAARLSDKTDVPAPLMWLPLLLEPEARTRHTFRPRVEVVRRATPYSGKTVMLIDDRAQSQSEYSALILRAAHGMTFIGSATAGANGEGSNFRVPGGIFVGMTGVGVSHPDGSQLQQIGVLPDIEVHPTIAGIRAGRDEVLERAVRHLEELTRKQ